MEISIPLEATYVSSNIEDTTDYFDNSVNQTYYSDMILREGDYLYKNSGVNIVPLDYSGTAADYKDGAIVYDTSESLLKKISELDDGSFVANDITTITDMTGFYQYETISEYKFLDGKNYTKVTQSGGTINYKVNVTGTFDTIAFGKVIADTISVVFRDANGTAVHTITDRVVYTDSQINNRLGTYCNVTKILYTPIEIENGSVEFTLKPITNIDMELGDIVVGISVGAGFTNLEFTNEFNDWSPRNQDQWGNWEYIDGVKTMVHSGKCDVPLTDYDMMNRMMGKIAMNTIIINGSDAKDFGYSSESLPNGETIFSSTMMIGRITRFKQYTRLSGNKLDKMARYDFTVEENV